jgi:preprotein translocase subunit SecE
LAEKAKKQNAIQRYFGETVGELRKVSWPTGSEARQLTLLVVVVMVGMGILLGLVDVLGTKLIDLALGI